MTTATIIQPHTMAGHKREIDALMQEAQRLLRESDEIHQAANRGEIDKRAAIKKALVLNERAVELTTKALKMVDANTAEQLRRRYEISLDGDQSQTTPTLGSTKNK